MPDHQTASAPRRRRALAFDRADWWLARGSVAVMALVAVIGGIVVPVADWVSGNGLDVPIDGPVTVAALDAAGLTYGDASYAVHVPDPTTTQRLLSLAPGVFVALVAVIGAWLVSRVLRAIVRGEAFGDETVRELRMLALLCLVVTFTWPFVAGSFVGALQDSLDVDGLSDRLTFTFAWWPLVVAAFVGAMGEAFNQARAMRTDLDGLI